MKQLRPNKAAPQQELGWTHPGAAVAEEMEVRGLTVAGFAAELGCPAAELDGLLAQTLPMTPILAAALERAWGAETEFWMRLQAGHDEAIRRGHGYL